MVVGHGTQGGALPTTEWNLTDLTLKLNMNKVQYREYLKSDHWKHLRRSKLKHKTRCGICGSRQNIQIHHLIYRNIYDVKTSDLRRLCGRCHQTVHELMKSGKLKITSKSHHGIWCHTKSAVKKELGLSKMKDTVDPLVWLIGNFTAT